MQLNVPSVHTPEAQILAEVIHKRIKPSTRITVNALPNIAVLLTIISTSRSAVVGRADGGYTSAAVPNGAMEPHQKPARLR
jgi:hypothetical protein